MLRLPRIRRLGLALAPVLVAAGSLGATAGFRAPRPGADLSALGAADEMVKVLQGNRTILWTSLSGPVTSYQVEGWPKTIGDNDLGGALVIEHTDASAGVIDFPEKPRSLSFEIGG